jgi:hypothetical protein
MPEKFAGKSAEDIAKAYSELESQYGKSQSAAKVAEAYARHGSPEDVQRIVEWATQADQMLKNGQLVKAGQQAKVSPLQAPANPWDADDWVLKSEGEKYNILSQKAIEAAQQHIDARAAEYGKQIEGIAARDAREKSILVQAIELARANNTPIETILSDAAEIGKKSPEELLQMALAARHNTPEARDAEVKKLVAAGVQEELQKREAAQMADFTRATTPRVSSLVRAHKEKDGFAQREAENRQILGKLSELGIKNPF